MQKAFLFLALLFLIHACANNTEEQNDREQPTSGTNQKPLLERGHEYTAALQSVLAGKLIQSVQDSGIAYALKFCSVNASPLTDSISLANGVRISRVSHRPRNPKNLASDVELTFISQYMEMLNNEEKTEGFILESKEGPTFYKPITIMAPLCLKCHGSIETDISENDLAVIQQLYPKDKATGFVMGELRGLWKVQFEQQLPN